MTRSAPRRSGFGRMRAAREVPRLPLVLVVDDEPAVLRCLERLLRTEPCEVVSTVDPEEALAWASLRPVDLVVADHRMPKMTGAELVTAFERRSPSTARILLTASPDAPDLPPPALRGQVRLIAKPWDDEELRRVVLECLPRPGGANPAAVPCRDRSGADVLADLARALEAGPGEEKRIRLEDLPRLRDSISKLLSEIVRRASRGPARLVLGDPSGLVRTFLEGIGGRTRFLDVEELEL
ncbi:MAG TPA: response regulator [Planctomycetota bacterium]|nr:response regulator [Planctomycetota bacterium]